MEEFCLKGHSPSPQSSFLLVLFPHPPQPLQGSLYYSHIYAGLWKARVMCAEEIKHIAFPYKMR